MVRIILAIIGGFLAWSILWIGSDQILIQLNPSWYGGHQLEFEKAMVNGTPFVADTTILALHIIRSIVISVICGYLAALIAGENRQAPLWLGVLLLAFGLLIQLMAWSYLPTWYHMIFLFLLAPMTVLGGKLKTFATPAPAPPPAETESGSE